MSSPESTNESKFTPLQKLGAGLLSAGTVGYGLYNPNGLGNVASWAATSVNDILQGGGEMINDAIGEGTSALLSNIPMAGAAAPFAAPMIAGGYLGKKVADILGAEKTYLKVAASVVGAGVGGLFATSAAAPYLTGAAVATALYKPAKFVAKKAGKSVSALYGGVTGAVKGGVQGVMLGGYNGAKHNWDGGHINPETGIKLGRQRAS